MSEASNTEVKVNQQLTTEFPHAAYFLSLRVKRALHATSIRKSVVISSSKASQDSLLFLSPYVSTLLYISSKNFLPTHFRRTP